MAEPATSEANAGPNPWLAFAGCAAIWGSTFLVISIGNDALAPVWAGALRLALAAVLLAIWSLVARIPMPRGAALQAAVWFGLLNFGLNFPLLYWGESRAPSGLSAVMFSTVPLSTALFARAFRMETLNPRKILGALVALGGVCLLFSGTLRGELSLPGLSAVLAAATVAALGSTLYKRGPRQSPIAANAVACAVGAVIAFTGSFLLRERHTLPLTAPALLPLLYLTVMGSLGAFVLYTWLVGRWPVSRAAYLGVVVPVIAVLLGSLVRHEPITATILGGSALVIAGLVVGMLGSVPARH